MPWKEQRLELLEALAFGYGEPSVISVFGCDAKPRKRLIHVLGSQYREKTSSSSSVCLWASCLMFINRRINHEGCYQYQCVFTKASI